jgi:tetratricopeptide (TPR) repeat protein
MGPFPRIAPQALLISLLLLLPASGLAQGVIDMGGMSDQDAKSHFKVGKSLYETGRFSEAAAEFEKAYRLSNRVELLYNVYVAHRDASDLPKAIDALRRYLQLATLDESTRVNLVARLRAMEEAEGRAAQPAATGATPPPSTQTQAPPPDAAPPPPAGSAQPEPALPPPPPAGSAELEMDADSSALPYALIAVGGAAVAAGIVTAVLAAGKISDIEDACPDDRCPPPSEFDLAAERDDARTLRTVAFALLGGGVIVGGAGATLLLLDAGDAAPSEAGTQAALRCAASGCTAALHGRF